MTTRTALILAIGVVLATLIHAVSTRYEVRIDNDGMVTVITDHWTGQHWANFNFKPKH